MERERQAERAAARAHAVNCRYKRNAGRCRFIRILIVTQYFWPENFKINDLAAELQARGHEITVLTGKPNYPSGRFYSGYSFWGKARENYKGCTVIRSPLIPRGNGGGVRLSANYLSFAFFSSVLAPVLCRDKYDAVFVYEISPITVGFPAIVMKKLLRKPLYFWVQDLWPESLTATGAVNSRFILARVGAMVRYIYKQCDVILVQSERFRHSIENQGVSPDKIRYLPNWAESYYRPQNPAGIARDPAFPEGFTVLFAGNMGAAQDMPTILEAAERLQHIREIKWVLIGNGRMKDWVEREIADRGLSEAVYLLGNRPPETMPTFFALADALLVTLRKSDIFSLTVPSKLQTYLACGKPIISNVDGETNRILEQAGAGIGCSFGQPGELAAAVLKLFHMDVRERAEMGERGYRYYKQHFDRRVLIDRLEQWLLAKSDGNSGGEGRAR